MSYVTNSTERGIMEEAVTLLNAVIMKTDEGIMLLGCVKSDDGEVWDAHECYKFCNDNISEFMDSHHSKRLKAEATLLNCDIKAEPNWYHSRDNFENVKIPYVMNVLPH